MSTPAQAPSAHTSLDVHTSPSSQDAPAFAGVGVHDPSRGSHAQSLHVWSSPEQSTGVSNSFRCPCRRCQPYRNHRHRTTHPRYSRKLGRACEQPVSVARIDRALVSVVAVIVWLTLHIPDLHCSILRALVPVIARVAVCGQRLADGGGTVGLADVDTGWTTLRIVGLAETPSPSDSMSSSVSPSQSLSNVSQVSGLYHGKILATVI